MTGPDLGAGISVWPLPPPVILPAGGEAPVVRIDAATLADVTAHARRNPTREVGGLLVGGVAPDGPATLVDVSGSLIAARTKGGRVHVTFTHASWHDLRERRQAAYPDAMVVGWYHTHPGLGLFLSDKDVTLHERVFHWQAWAVALVVDPIANAWAFFWPQGDRVVRCSEVGAGAR